MNPNEEMAYRKAQQENRDILQCECGAYSTKSEHTMWLKCSYCGRLMYINPEFSQMTVDVQMQVVQHGRTQDGEWVEVKDLSTGEVSTYWKEG